MRILIVFFYFALIQLSTSQTTEIDSLIQELSKTSAESLERVEIMNTLGYEYWIINPDQSIKYGRDALQLSTQLNYPEGIAKANRVIGVAYWAQGDQNNALKYLTDSHRKYKAIADKEGIANTLLNIGMIYADLERYEKAIENYNLAITLFTALNLSDRIATTFTKLGSIHIERGNYKDARNYITDALQIHTKNKFTYGIAEAHNRLGILSLEETELEQAKYHIERSIRLGKKINDRDGLVSNLILYGKLHRLQKNYTDANKQLLSGLEKAKKNNLKKYELQALNELKELRKEEKKLEDALEYYDAYIDIKDSILSTKKAQQIAYIEFENQLESQDKQLQLLKEKEKTNQIVRWSLILGILIILISSFLIMRSYKIRSKKNQELLQSKELLNQKIIENQELRQQELTQQLEFKNKELTSYALNFVQKNELLALLQHKLLFAKRATPKEKEKLMNDLFKIIQQNLNREKDWEDFKHIFEEVHIGFYSKLKSKHPDLSTNDLKVCALTRLNFNIKETANVLGISPESAKTARYRLRKKLNLNQEQGLLSYFINIENG